MKKAFTLVELTVVLAVLAVLANLAVRELSRFRDGRLSAAADRQLEEIRGAVYCRGAGGDASGFLADMGRMPAVTNSTLSELWRRPAGAKLYAVRHAQENLFAGAPAQLAGMAAGVYVPTGWRGPYLRLPFGRDRLLDPWGNPMEAVDDAGLARLWVSNGFASAVSHYGPSAQASGMRRLSLLPDGGLACRLVVSPVSASAYAGDVTYAWFGPAGGTVTGAVKTAICPSPVVFEGLTPGIRILKESRTGAARVVDVRPGDNLVSVALP